jgi:SAM-dependent methyltransferase
MEKQGLDLSAQCMDELTSEDLQRFIIGAVTHRVESLPPRDGLRFLFGLDASLYELQGRLSVAYGGGVHTKHRALAFDVADKSGAQVVGMDLSPDNIAIANTRYHHFNVTYLVGDALQISMDGNFDVVILSNVLEHLRQRPEFLRRVVETIHPTRVLLRVPLFERDWRVPLKEEVGIDYRLDPNHFTEYTLESFALEIKEAGLKVTHQEVRWGEIWAEAVPQ